MSKDEDFGFRALVSVTGILFVILLIAFATTLLGGCESLPKTETVVQVVKTEAPPKPAGIPECEIDAVRPPVAVKKVAGDKTPVEATEEALLANGSRLRQGRIAHRRCYCWQVANDLVVGVDKAKAEKACKDVNYTGKTS